MLAYHLYLYLYSYICSCIFISVYLQVTDNYLLLLSAFLDRLLNCPRRKTTQTIDKTKRIKIKSYGKPKPRYTTIHILYIFSLPAVDVKKTLQILIYFFLRGAASQCAQIEIIKIN